MSRRPAATGLRCGRGLLPVLLLWVLHLLEPGTMRLLYTTPHGWAVLVVLATLLGVGAVLIRRIVRIDV